MKYLKSVSQFFSLNEQLFKFASDELNRLMGISIEKEGGEEPNLFQAENPEGTGQARVPIQKLSPEQYDNYGTKVGITNKDETGPLQQPSSGPIGNIANSAYANINVPTRGIPGTERGNLGCAAARGPGMPEPLGAADTAPKVCAANDSICAGVASSGPSKT